MKGKHENKRERELLLHLFVGQLLTANTFVSHSHPPNTFELPSQVNLLHYDDAASLVVAALTQGSKGAVYLGCDNNPRTRQALADAAGAVLGGKCKFTGGADSPGGSGRAMNNAWTREALGGWEPQWSTFEDCMQAQAK